MVTSSPLFNDLEVNLPLYCRSCLIQVKAGAARERATIALGATIQSLRAWQVFALVCWLVAGVLSGMALLPQCTIFWVIRALTRSNAPSRGPSLPAFSASSVEQIIATGLQTPRRERYCAPVRFHRVAQNRTPRATPPIMPRIGRGPAVDP